MRIFAFCGADGSGKSTAAKLLIEKYGFKKISFAEPMKRSLQAALDVDDDYLFGSKKEEMMVNRSGVALNCTGRQAMQRYGMYGREGFLAMIGATPDLSAGTWWLTKARAEMIANDGNWVIDDLRFPDEVEMLNKVGARIVRIVNHAIEDTIVSKHASQQHYEQFAVDRAVVNDVDKGTAWFHARVIEELELE